jgi:hypothetical protein
MSTVDGSAARYGDRMPKADPKVRRRIRQMAERDWGEPVLVVYLGDVDPEFRVPGRRRNGTVVGTGKVAQFFRMVLRYTIGGLVNVVLSVLAGGVANILERDGLVTGPANAQALPMVDAAKRARTAWLVRSDSYLAVVDTGPLYGEPTDPKTVWQATKPATPELTTRHRRLTWPDGSTFTFAVDPEEAATLRNHRRTELGL